MKSPRLIRILVSAEIIVLALSFYFNSVCQTPPLIEKCIEHYSKDAFFDPFVFEVLAIAVIVGIVSSWIGLLCLWKPARWLYIGTHLFTVISTPLLGLTFKMPLVKMSSEISQMITGALILLLLSKPSQN